MATSPPPPGLPRCRRQSGVFAIVRVREVPKSERLRVRLKRPLKRPDSAQQLLSIPYRDDWKSPSWILAYALVLGFVVWSLVRC